MKNTKIAIKIPHIQFIAAGGIQWGDIQGFVDKQEDLVDFVNNTISTNIADSLNVIKNALEDIGMDISTLQANENFLQSDVTSIKDDINTINVAIDSINSEISNIQSDILMVKGKVSTIEGLVDLINTSIDNINIELTTVNNLITNIENRVISVEGDITSIQGDITTINADISDIQDDIISINDTINNLINTLDIVEWAKNKKIENSTVDLNTLVNNGIYYIGGGGQIQINRPSSYNGILIVGASGEFVYQLYYNVNTIYVRNSGSSGVTWNGWINFLNSNNLTTINNSLNNKVDKVAGLGLSQNNFTTVLLQKLNAIEDQAQKNVQSDWDQTDNTADDYIKNKPNQSIQLVSSLPATPISNVLYLIPE